MHYFELILLQKALLANIWHKNTVHPFYKSLFWKNKRKA